MSWCHVGARWSCWVEIYEDTCGIPDWSCSWRFSGLVKQQAVALTDSKKQSAISSSYQKATTSRIAGTWTGSGNSFIGRETYRTRNTFLKCILECGTATFLGITAEMVHTMMGTSSGSETKFSSLSTSSISLVSQLWPQLQ